MNELQGRRLPNLVFEEKSYWPKNGTSTWLAGDYALVDRGGHRELWFIDPYGHLGRVRAHKITEEDDGTISVDPSIAGEPGDFHGWLRRGIWNWVN